ncbi:MAG TPA: DUF2238 domain-containing protein [Candidatus Nanoarchaeia archaeon]|nr:DUF2238 domain-containing protein [Candidatus Nanoarchaeia archaeon]
MSWFTNRNYPKFLLIAYLIFFAITTINPPHPSDFILEHVMTVVFIAVLLLTYKKFPLSHVSYTLIFVFMILHTIGAHYTYAEVPYNEWFMSIFGIGLNELCGLSRNHFDRLVHFSFGLLLAYPIREIFLRIADAKGFWSYYLPIDMTMAFSMIYELIEWFVAIHFGGDLGMTYLGTQGDEWDAHKDMALATLGSIISMSMVAIINWRYKKNFSEDFQKSLSIKRKIPLGEVELNKMRKLIRKK